MIKQVKEMPTRGQFLAEWTQDGSARSETYEWIGGELCAGDDAEPCSDDEVEFLMRGSATLFVEVTE